MEAAHVGNDSPVRAYDGNRGGPKINADTKAHWSNQRVHPEVLGIVVSHAEHDGRGGVPCIPISIGTPLVGTCGCPRARRLRDGDGDGPTFGGVLQSWGQGQSRWREKGV